MTQSDDKSRQYFRKASSVLGMAAFSPALNSKARMTSMWQIEAGVAF